MSDVRHTVRLLTDAARQLDEAHAVPPSLAGTTRRHLPWSYGQLDGGHTHARAEVGQPLPGAGGRLRLNILSVEWGRHQIAAVSYGL